MVSRSLCKTKQNDDRQSGAKHLCMGKFYHAFQYVEGRGHLLDAGEERELGLGALVGDRVHHVAVHALLELCAMQPPPVTCAGQTLIAVLPTCCLGSAGGQCRGINAALI